MLFKESDDRDEMTEEELLNVYVEKLKNLVEHPDIWRPLDLPYHSTVWPDGTEEMKTATKLQKTEETADKGILYLRPER